MRCVINETASCIFLHVSWDISLRIVLTAADVTDDLENNLSASLNFLFLLSALLFVFLKNKQNIVHFMSEYRCSRGVEIAKVYTCPGIGNCHMVLVQRKFCLSHIQEQIIQKDLSEALIELKQYTCINSFRNSMKPDINY